MVLFYLQKINKYININKKQIMSFDINLYGESIDDNVIENPLHLFCQEIELAVKIPSDDIWGLVGDIDLRAYTFNQYYSIDKIKKNISEYIATQCSQAEFFIYTVEVDLLEYENKELLYINVNIQDTENEDKTFVQKFLLNF